MNKKKLFLTLGLLTIAFICQAMEPAKTWKAKKAALNEAQTQALNAKDYAQFGSPLAQARNEKLKHSLQKAQATDLDIRFAKAVEANDHAAVKELITQGANVNIKWLGKPALIHVISNEKTINLPLFESLLSSPALNVNATDKEGNTVLGEIHKTRRNIANSDRYEEKDHLLAAAKLLIERDDCNLNAKNKSGKTIISLAFDNLNKVGDYGLRDYGLINLLLDRAKRDLPSNQKVVAEQYKKNIDHLSANKFNTYHWTTPTYFTYLPADIFGILKPADTVSKPSQPIDLTDVIICIPENQYPIDMFGHKCKDRIEKIIEEQKTL